MGPLLPPTGLPFPVDAASFGSPGRFPVPGAAVAPPEPSAAGRPSPVSPVGNDGFGGSRSEVRRPRRTSRRRRAARVEKVLQEVGLEVAQDLVDAPALGQEGDDHHPRATPRAGPRVALEHPPDRRPPLVRLFDFSSQAVSATGFGEIPPSAAR